MEGIAKKIGLPRKVTMFGSFSNGCKNGTSDFDIALVSKIDAGQAVHYLAKIAEQLPSCGFGNVTRVFQASTKLLKFTDVRTQAEVDFCINNDLGVRNSRMLGCYCEVDQRVSKLGRLIKDWAKRRGLVGSADGYLNSYAYMLLTVFYLQQTTPPVLPNLQKMATEPFLVDSDKWGMEDTWDTKFWDDIGGLEKSSNEMTVSQLLIGFFHFYGFAFEWKSCAVCIRESQPGQSVNKFTLQTRVIEEQWYIEDPFDLRHNLAGRCSRAGRERILSTMRDTHEVLSSKGRWALACPLRESSKHFLKCRTAHDVTPQAFLEAFEEFELVKLHFPKPCDQGSRHLNTFLEFRTSAARRRAHTKNECHLEGCSQQLHLHASSQHALEDAMQALEATGGSYSTFEMLPYKLQRRVQQNRCGLDGASAWHGVEQQEIQLDAAIDSCEAVLIQQLSDAATHIDYCQFRDILMDHLMEAGNLISRAVTSERHIVERVFGGDCARISRLRALLDAAGQVEQHNQAVVACSSACEVAERLLWDLGLSEQLELRQVRERERLQALQHARRIRQHPLSQAAAQGRGPAPWLPGEQPEGWPCGQDQDASRDHAGGGPAATLPAPLPACARPPGTFRPKPAVPAVGPWVGPWRAAALAASSAACPRPPPLPKGAPPPPHGAAAPPAPPALPPPVAVVRASASDRQFCAWATTSAALAAPAVFLGAAAVLATCSPAVAAAAATATVGHASDLLLTTSSYLDALAEGGVDNGAFVQILDSSSRLLEGAAPGLLATAAGLVTSATQYIIDDPDPA
ncbi:unnamed protein product [Prorocentrum cordatum]|uniref:Polynucleotide adenylyltransferase n=1 Tax=Prorocentrum cordatum TaxID=2364126 RepID=A0ABN9S4L1_9DINO|nr:unnamed protein product [Polarella glacialis]